MWSAQLSSVLHVGQSRIKRSTRLCCLEEGSEPAYNILHKKAAQPKLLSPKCPSTTSPTVGDDDSVYALCPHRSCDTVVCIGTMPFGKPSDSSKQHGNPGAV